MKDFLVKYFKILLVSSIPLIFSFVMTLLSFSSGDINNFLCVMLFVWPTFALSSLIVSIIMTCKLHDSKKSRVITIILLPTMYSVLFLLFVVIRLFFTNWSLNF